ncbi:MAG: DUF1559 domain-containing protein [Planctomycetaceae bacterium]
MKAQQRSNQCKRRHAFTVIELLVTITVVGILVGLLLPAIQSARETSRRTQCTNNLRQLGIASLTFESTHGHFPPSTDLTDGKLENWVLNLMPYLECQGFVQSVDQIVGDFRTGLGDRRWHLIERKLLELSPPRFHCPSDSWSIPGTVSYAGNAGNWVPQYGFNGMFRSIGKDDHLLVAGPIRSGDVTDGLSNTALIAEWLPGNMMWDKERIDRSEGRRSYWVLPINSADGTELRTMTDECSKVPPVNPEQYGWRRDGAIGVPWIYATPGTTMYYHAMPPNAPSCRALTYPWGVNSGLYTAASLHREGVNVVFADGHISFISSLIDIEIWQQMGSRSPDVGIRTFQ